MCRINGKILVTIFMLLVSMTIAQPEIEPTTTTSTTTTSRRPSPPPTRAPTTTTRGPTPSSTTTTRSTTSATTTTTSTRRPTLPTVSVIRPPFPPTTTTGRTTRPPFITIRPPVEPCPPSNNCTRKSPVICGRNIEGMCHRFDSICELKLTNCATRNRLHAWHRVPMMQCRALRANAIDRCNIYTPRCLRPLLPCPLSTRRGLCIISRNRRMCRLVGNRCCLRNLNCIAMPRERWTVTNAISCHGMRIGAGPAACVR